LANPAAYRQGSLFQKWLLPGIATQPISIHANKNPGAGGAM
jgi:hypothetical protein